MKKEDLRIQQGRLIVNGKELVLPLLEHERVAVAGADTTGLFYVGTSRCCTGRVYHLLPPSVWSRNDESKGYKLHDVFTPDLNVYDLFPVQVDEEKLGWQQRDGGRGLLVLGVGCAGAGVRLISMKNAKSAEIMPTAEYMTLLAPNADYFQSQRFVTEKGICVAIGPSKVDLTDRLQAAGVAVRKSIEQAKRGDFARAYGI